MIVTNIENIENQLNLNSRFKKAIDFMRRVDWNKNKDGVIPIDGKRVYGNLQTYKNQIPKS